MERDQGKITLASDLPLGVSTSLSLAMQVVMATARITKRANTFMMSSKLKKCDNW